VQKTIRMIADPKNVAVAVFTSTKLLDYHPVLPKGDVQSDRHCSRGTKPFDGICPPSVLGER
jgi:hypothetical protein